MTGFSDLSNELILEILRRVAPRDLDSACTITKSISLLAAPILKEHRKLKQQFSYSNIFHDEHDVLFKILVEVLAKPRIALYVRSLILDFNGPGWYSLGQVSRFDSNSLQLIRTAIENTGIILPDVVDERLEANQDSIDNRSLLDLLLLHLSDLNSLKIFLLANSIQFFCEAIQGIQDVPAGTYLPHLKRVSINCLAIADWGRHYVMRSLVTLLALPSLVSCDVEGLSIRDEDYAIGTIGCSQRFNITDLSFLDCAIGSKTLNELLGKTQNLESFSCVFSKARFSSEQFGLDWYWLGAGLLLNTKHSLQKLQLQSNGLDFIGAVCSLSEFKLLREIHIELPVFLCDWGMDSDNFRKMLPASIQKIHLSAILSP